MGNYFTYKPPPFASLSSTPKVYTAEEVLRDPSVLQDPTPHFATPMEGIYEYTRQRDARLGIIAPEPMPGGPDGLDLTDPEAYARWRYAQSAPPDMAPAAATAPAPTPAPIGVSAPPEAPRGDLKPGQISIDLTDPIGSAGEAIGSLATFAGGVAGAIGSIGPDGETASIGQLFEDVGRIPGGIGDLQLPYLGNDPNRQQATLSQVPGAIFEPAYQGYQALSRETAKGRVQGALEGQYLADGFDPLGLATLIGRAGGATYEEGLQLPADLQARLDAGESVDVIADELVTRGQSYANDGVTQLAYEIAYDPLNLVAPGGSAALGAARRASLAVRTADDLSRLGMSTRAIGTAYDAAARGLSAAGQRVTGAMLGPTTSGVLHTLGTKPYQTIRSGLAALDRHYGQAFEDAFALGAAQMPRAVIAHQMADEASALLRRFGSDAMDRLPDVSPTIEGRLDVVRKLAPDDIERRSQELLARVAPTFDGIPADVLAATTARKLAAITGASPEDAARILGTVDRQAAQTVHLAYYGRAGDDLAAARADIGTAKNIDVQRLTIVSDDTLTAERADELLAGGDLAAAVERYGILANRFAGKQFDHAAVRAFIQQLRNSDALITTVTRPTTGRNKLPPALAAWRTRYIDEGYDLGFAPEGGWKAVLDEEGVPVYADPFSHFVSARDPITVRNPLGRFVDSLMRGTTQTTIVGESRQRLVDAVQARGLPVSPNQTRAIHRAILEEAADRGVTPRSLVADTNLVRRGDGTSERVGVIDSIFQRFLSADEYTAVKNAVDPTFLVMSAFRGNLRTVGLTQYLTGGAKAVPGLGPYGAQVAERIYPQVRFVLNPLFQLQELIESRFFNALRGIVRREVDPEVAAVYRELTQLPELRYLSEAGYFLNLSSGAAVTRYVGSNTAIGRALGRFADVQGQKAAQRVAQVVGEHGDEFRDAMQQINPRAWKAMEEAYGTTDSRAIADAYMRERFAIGPDEDIADALAYFDRTRALGSTAADEAIWQAFRTTFEQASRQAFRTHFFNPQRGWLERTLNHPYLGIYPLSYMYGKVLPEFARFLLRRPFGQDVPLVGAANLVRVQQAAAGAIADDPEFRAFLDDHPDALYLLHQLIPGDPTNLGAGAPAWMRHVAEDARAGRPVTADTVGREAIDTAGYAFGAVRGPVTIAEGVADLGDAAADVFANLDRAAREWDGLAVSAR